MSLAETNRERERAKREAEEALPEAERAARLQRELLEEARRQIELLGRPPRRVEADLIRRGASPEAARALVLEVAGSKLRLEGVALPGMVVFLFGGLIALTLSIVNVVHFEHGRLIVSPGALAGVGVGGATIAGMGLLLVVGVVGANLVARRGSRRS